MNKPITLCDRCGFEMSCLLNYDGISCRKNRTIEPTNADRIRAMTDEELASWIVHKTDGRGFDGYKERVNAWLDWLRQEVDNG